MPNQLRPGTEGEQPSRRVGRPPKGDREALSLKLPRDHKQLYQEAAAEMGIPIGDYVALVLAAAHDLPEPDYVFPNSRHDDDESSSLAMAG